MHVYVGRVFIDGERDRIGPIVSGERALGLRVDGNKQCSVADDCERSYQ